MDKLPYGGYDFDCYSENDDPWTRLETIQVCLEEGELLPPELARWLGEAIERSDRNSGDLLKNLGLQKRSGRQAKAHNVDGWLRWGGRVFYLEGFEKLKTEEALKKTLEEYALEHTDACDRRTMQRWRNKYKKAHAEHSRIATKR